MEAHVLNFADLNHSASLPPSLQSGRHVHEGILMEIIRSGTSDWQAGLDSLSGGQRTMVSLAFVVAVSLCPAMYKKKKKKKMHVAILTVI
jgi:hypothetical protein